MDVIDIVGGNVLVYVEDYDRKIVNQPGNLMKNTLTIRFCSEFHRKSKFEQHSIKLPKFN